jgi:hypothetical protein
MPQGNLFSSSSRSQMGSGYRVTQNQGGGEKKAGFPYQIGRGAWVSIYFQSVDPVHGHCCKLSGLQQTLVFTRNTVRPVNSDPRIPMR